MRLNKGIKLKSIFSDPISNLPEASACIGRFIGLYFDRKEIRIKEVKNENYFNQ
jgi:hypothetical protein